MEKEKEKAAEEDRISKEFCPALLTHKQFIRRKSYERDIRKDT